MRAHKGGIFAPFKEIASAIKDMPPLLWQLALVYLFQWYAMFVYWQFVSHSIAASVWGITSESDPKGYEEVVGWTGLVNGWYNVVTFLSAFALVGLARKYSAKFVHITCLFIASIALAVFPHITNKYVLFVPMIGFGIAWASMMGVPYIMVVSAIPKHRYGVYMGIVNMMIVIPMILQTLSFGYIYKNWLGSDPGRAIIFASILLFFAALAMMRTKVSSEGEEAGEVLMPAGH